MNQYQATNVVALLQKEPLYYRNFGVWWWWVKSEVKRWGFTKDNLVHLGEFTDPSVTHYYAGLTPAERTNAAYRFQSEHVFHKYNFDHSFAPDGDVYYCLDQDAE